MYTSGTSGEPKGVILTHEAAATCVIGLDLCMDQFEDEVTLNRFKGTHRTCFAFCADKRSV